MKSKLCKNCNKEFKVYPSLDRVIFCSLECYYSSKRGSKVSEETRKKISATMIEKGIRPVKFFYGADCNFWKGGVNRKNKTLRRLIRDLLVYKKWRQAIFERDNFLCVICGNGGRIEADHYPHPFGMILNSFIGIEKPEDAVNLPFLWDLENGRTLCVNCHKEYGYQHHKKSSTTLFDEVSRG